MALIHHWMQVNHHHLPLLNAVKDVRRTVLSLLLCSPIKKWMTSLLMVLDVTLLVKVHQRQTQAAKSRCKICFVTICFFLPSRSRWMQLTTGEHSSLWIRSMFVRALEPEIQQSLIQLHLFTFACTADLQLLLPLVTTANKYWYQVLSDQQVLFKSNNMCHL